MKHFLTPLLFLLVSLTVAAQKGTVSGSVVDTSGEPLPGATVVIMKLDSAQVTGQQTRADGTFSIGSIPIGDYLLRASFIGYKTVFRPITLTKKNRQIALGEIALRENAKLMREAEVTARAAQMEMKADTFVYNADAFRIPEGSNFEALLKKFPGAEITEEGTIKINGKEVKRILVNEKEFFGGDAQMTLKNLPAKMVSKVKAYDRQSDYSRMTGIDDGEEETVLDLTVKKGMTEGWNLNVDAAGGTPTESSVRSEYPFLYSGKLNLTRFTDNLNLAVIGSMNNVNDRGFGGWGRGSSGMTTVANPGANFAWNNGKKQNEAGRIEVGGNVRYRYQKNETVTKTNSESFLTTSASQFVNSLSNSFNRSKNVNSDFRVEWQPDSMTNIIFRPDFSYSNSDNESENRSVTFNDSPYEAGMTNPLDEFTTRADNGSLLYQNILVNDNHRQSRGDSHSYTLNGYVQANRRLNKPGRNVTLDLGGSIGESSRESYSRSLVNYYQNVRTPQTFTNQYTENPSENWNWRVRASYSEPLFKGANLQVSYQFQRRFSDSDRSMYSIDSLLTKDEYAYLWGDMTREEIVQTLVLGYKPSETLLSGLRNIENSQYATYNEYNHDASVMFRYQVGSFNLNAGVSFQPQTTHMDYQKHYLDTTVTRHVFNWAPRIDLRWKISNTSQLRARYNGRMSQPSMTQLLDVSDTSDPLNISHGNPSLDPSWSNRFNIFYNNYIVDKQMGWFTRLYFNNTLNSISNRTTYNLETGARETRPENINGNWDAGFFGNFNTALGSKKYWNINNRVDVNYNNRVGYMSLDRAESVKATTKQTTVGDNLRLNYRNDWLEVGVNGGFSFSHARNDVRESANLDTWSFNYGGNLQLNAPWGMSLAMDITQESRRGYDDESMNTNELIWNAQLSQTFLKNKALTLSVQCYDILQQRSNISRALSAIQRSDTWSNAINSYVMVHVIYNFNLMGNKEARREGFNGPPEGGRGEGRGEGRGGGRGERPNGPPPGGFGGGRPGGFGGR